MIKRWLRNYIEKNIQAIDASIAALEPEYQLLVDEARRKRDAACRSAEEVYDAEFERLGRALETQKHILQYERDERSDFIKKWGF